MEHLLFYCRLRSSEWPQRTQSFSFIPSEARASASTECLPLWMLLDHPNTQITHAHIAGTAQHNICRIHTSRKRFSLVSTVSGLRGRAMLLSPSRNRCTKSGPKIMQPNTRVLRSHESRSLETTESDRSKVYKNAIDSSRRSNLNTEDDAKRTGNIQLETQGQYLCASKTRYSHCPSSAQSNDQPCAAREQDRSISYRRQVI